MERNEMARVPLSWWRFLPVAARSGHSKNSTFMSRTRPEILPVLWGGQSCPQSAFGGRTRWKRVRSLPKAPPPSGSMLHILPAAPHQGCIILT
jgi:hypothetical protein